MPFSADPCYTDVRTPAGWVRHQAEQRGIRVRVIEDLAHLGYSSPDGRTIVVRAGLVFPTFHWIIACGVVANKFGLDVSPDLQMEGPPPLTETAVGDAQIIQLRRRVISGPIAGGLPR